MIWVIRRDCKSIKYVVLICKSMKYVVLNMQVYEVCSTKYASL